jgi:hypothetical protein
MTQNKVEDMVEAVKVQMENPAVRTGVIVGITGTVLAGGLISGLVLGGLGAVLANDK